MTAKKIDAMHARFGTADGTCGECEHLISRSFCEKKYYKCGAYGVSSSISTDWAKRWPACGLKGNPIPHGRSVMDQLRYAKDHYEPPIEGQITMEELINGKGQ